MRLSPLLWLGAASARQLGARQPIQPRQPAYGSIIGPPVVQISDGQIQAPTSQGCPPQNAPPSTVTTTVVSVSTVTAGSFGSCSDPFNISPSSSTPSTTLPTLLITTLPPSLSTLPTSTVTSLSLSPSSSVPSCTPVPKGPNPQKSGTPNFTFEELYKLQTNFLDNFMYPQNVVQAQSINSSLFAENIRGRVDVTRTFVGPELNTEYLFGLFATLSLNPDAISLLGYPVNYTIVHFAANQNIASAATIIQFNFASLGLVVPVEIDTWNLFDADGKILEYDATFRWFQYLYDTLFASVAPKINATSPAQVQAYFTRALATGICRTHQDYCNGTNTQFSSYNSCFDFMTTKIRFGQAYELGMNTLLCRMVHQNMIPYRPEVHCPHIGPSGGGSCVDDYTYMSKVLEPFFTEAPFVPYGYQNSNATLAAM